MNKLLLTMLLVLRAVVLLLAILALGYSRNWGVSAEATSTPTSEFPTLGALEATPTRSPIPTQTPNLTLAPTSSCGDVFPCPAPTPTLTPRIPIIDTFVARVSRTPRTPTPTH